MTVNRDDAGETEIDENDKSLFLIKKFPRFFLYSGYTCLVIAVLVTLLMIVVSIVYFVPDANHWIRLVFADAMCVYWGNTLIKQSKRFLPPKKQ